MVEGGFEQGKQVFLEEAKELLEQLESDLLELEESPENMEVVGSVFRALHTIKGSGAMFGFTRVSEFVHNIENLFDKVRSGSLPVSQEMIDLTLRAKDLVRTMIREEIDQEEQVDEQELNDVLEIVNRLAGQEGKVSQEPKPEGEPAASSLPVTYRIKFRPPKNILATGLSPATILDDLKELGRCDFVGITKEIPRLSNIDPESIYIWWDILLTTDKPKETIEDVFMFVADEAEISIEVIQSIDPEKGGKVEFKRLGDVLVSRGDITQEELKEALKEQKRVGDILVEKGLISKETLSLALKTQRHLKDAARDIRRAKREQEELTSIRVDARKLDTLINLVSELVTTQARLAGVAERLSTPELHEVVGEVERLVAGLKDNALGLRMMPVGSVFGKFRRLVRDTAKKLGKEVRLEIYGAETELDKTVIEKLSDPLMHLIRNSIDHGIEPPEERERSGKPRYGTVWLEAERSGTHVMIRVRDDGRGMDPEIIRQKAIERGLISPDAQLSKGEILSMVFQPGFSTASQVSDISGRGVGMDVVRKNIVSLRGEVLIDSELGEGTTVTLQLPMTLAIVEGLLVKVRENKYVFPLSDVERCVEFEEVVEGMPNSLSVVNIKGELVPFLSLKERFFSEGNGEGGRVVVVNAGSKKVGFLVDKVIGNRQIVIKGMGELGKRVKDFSGAAVLGDGTIALILDVKQLSNEVAAVQ